MHIEPTMRPLLSGEGLSPNNLTMPGEEAVDFVAVLDQVTALLRQRGRVAYRTIKRQFQLDDEALEDLKVELIESQRLATDDQGTVLVWTGAADVPLREQRRHRQPPHPVATRQPTSQKKFSPPALPWKVSASR